MATKGDVLSRQEAKYRILANLLRREISVVELRHWYRLIDWIIKLPEDANRVVWLRLEQIKEPRTMSHITYAEIIGHEKGLKEGRTEGLKEGLRELLLAKFAEQGPALVAEFENETNLDRLKTLLQAAGLASSPEDFRARVLPPS